MPKKPKMTPEEAQKAKETYSKQINDAVKVALVDSHPTPEQTREINNDRNAAQLKLKQILEDCEITRKEAKEFSKLMKELKHDMKEVDGYKENKNLYKAMDKYDRAYEKALKDGKLSKCENHELEAKASHVAHKAKKAGKHIEVH